eukprot:gene1584-biopygen1398
MEQPTPRVALGQALRGIASSAVDVSDGLIGDLGHILAASGVGAEIALGQLPTAPALALLPEARRIDCLLNGGDDVGRDELIFRQQSRVEPDTHRISRAECLDTPDTLHSLDGRLNLVGHDIAQLIRRVTVLVSNDVADHHDARGGAGDADAGVLHCGRQLALDRRHLVLNLNLRRVGIDRVGEGQRQARRARRGTALHVKQPLKSGHAVLENGRN